LSADPPAGQPDADDADEPSRPRSLIASGNGHRPAGPIDPGPLEEAPLAPLAVAEGLPPAPPTGPPGSAVFSLEGRPAAGLYFAAWAVSLVAVVVLFVAFQAAIPLARALLFLVGLAALVLGMSLGAGYQVLARRSRPAPAYRGPSPVLLFAIATAASTGIGALLFGLGAIDTEAPLGFLAAIGFVQAAYVVGIVVFVVRSGALRWADMGWPPAREVAGRLLTDAGLSIVVMLPATLLFAVFAGLVAQALDVSAPSVLPTARTSGDAVALLIAAALLAPVGEELFFRGFALTAWHRDLGPRAALVRSSVFFALVHVANVDATDLSSGLRQALLELIVILPIGFVLGWLFQRRGILASIAGHATYNGFLLVLVFVAQRLPPPG
jgi:membrane protease YdiL (CAAX protease family)